MVANLMLAGQQEGFTFNELLVSMVLTISVVMGYSLSTVNLFRRQVASDNSTVATNLAQAKIEELQAQRPLLDANTCESGGEHGLSAKSGAKGIFDRCWRIGASSFAADLKQIDVIVSWRDHDTKQVALSTLIYTGD